MSARMIDRIDPKRREKILDLWRDGYTGPVMASRFGVSASCINYIVAQARAAGDPRAVARGQARPA